MEVLTLEVDAAEVFPAHDHQQHELLWAAGGTLEVEIEGRRWVLSPTEAMWIPAGVVHAATVARATVLTCVFEDPPRCPLVWDEPTVARVTPLVRELLGYLGSEDTRRGPRSRSRLLLLELLEPVGHAGLALPLPRDGRARTIAEGLLAAPGDPRGLDDWARVFGTSVRTLTRAFVDGTGMAFTQWRTQARLQASLAMLADQVPVQEVAGRVGYASAASYIAAFRRQFGHTPASHFP